MLRRGKPATGPSRTLMGRSPRRTENPPMRPHRLVAFAVAMLVGPAIATAASTVPLPASVGRADVVFASGFEMTPAVPADPSNGSGGPYPGDQSRVVNVAGLGSHIVYLYVPTTYSPARAMPLLLAMHGTAG